MSRPSCASARHARPSSSPAAEAGRPARLQILKQAASPHVEEPADEALAAGLTAFDVEEDIESIVAMPPTIPRALRRVLTTAFARRFDYHAELDVWLHLPHPALGAETPFERLVGGDGWSVLRALVGTRAAAHAVVGRRVADRAPQTAPRLRLVPSSQRHPAPSVSPVAVGADTGGTGLALSVAGCTI